MIVCKCVRTRSVTGFPEGLQESRGSFLGFRAVSGERQNLH